ncbi:MAG: hypothetical protein LUC90_04260 [Lachnospiraceae bacterium]|nr:hypothetical protein [Lachnospiraceae bacterium]
MVKNIFRRFVAATLSATLILSLAGCNGITGNKTDSSAQQGENEAADSQNIENYAVSETTLEALNDYAEVGEGGIFYDMAVYDDRIYLVYARNGRRLGTSSGNLIYYSSWDLEENQLSDVMFLDTGENLASKVMSDTGENAVSDVKLNAGHYPAE